MQQRNHQLNGMTAIVNKYDCVFASPDAKNISFSCDYLKQFHIKKK